MKRSLSTCVMMVAALIVFGVSISGAAQEQKKDSAKATPPAPAASAVSDASYVIGPEDVLNIDVWKEQEISRSVPVRPDGKISLPLLNDVQAAGLTPMQLQANLRDEFKKYISDPQVTVIVVQVNSRRIYVLGEVAHPGTFPLLPRMTVLQALSTAGGFSQFAKEKDVYVLRTENGQQKTLPFNYKDVVRGKRADENIELKPGDTVVVP